MTINLRDLANRPASSVSDADVAAAIEVMLADPRVTKAIHVGRENGAPDGRQMIDFAMVGFEGVHTVGRCISAFYDASRLQQIAFDKARAEEAKARHKRDALNKKLLALAVPYPGRDEEFDDFADGIEADLTGVPGSLVDDKLERARLYLAYLDSKKIKKPKAPRWTGPSLKGLGGSTKQKHWAAQIRAEKLGSFSEENRKFFDENTVHSSFWIEYRNHTGAEISARMDTVYAKLQAAISARVAYAKEHATERGVVITGEYNDLLNAVSAAQAKWHRLLDGEDKW
ncbi:hypothetical protein [Devosia submarina]|uniref:hypothetical protein n=1 Tax=Devosia submarina TaxID=1173082 RepID=UPI000D35F9F5|nr:hypothetical protein [Devosia submarina]